MGVGLETDDNGQIGLRKAVWPWSMATSWLFDPVSPWFIRLAASGVLGHG